MGKAAEIFEVLAAFLELKFRDVSRIMNYMKKLKNYNIRTKLIIGFLAALIPLVLILEIASYWYAAQIVMDKTLEQVGETVEQFSHAMDYFMAQNINKLETIGYSPVVQKVLNEEEWEREDLPDDDLFFSDDRQIQRSMLREFYSVTMNDMELYGLNGASYYVSVWSQKRVIPGEEAILRRADETKGKWILILYEQEDDTLQLIKQVRDIQTYTPIGYIRIGLKRSYFDEMAAGISFDSDGRILILQDQSLITGSGNSEEITALISQETSSRGNFRYEEDGKTYEVVYVYSGEMNWKTAGLIPVDYINRELTGLTYTAIVLCILSVLVGVLAVSRIARSLVAPIQETADALEQFSRGDFGVRLPQGRQDEIGKMNEVFNKAIGDIQKLMREVTQAELLQKEMEFKTLQSQMNPHFIYNTLDAINWMAFKKGEHEICDLVTAVSNLMRASISNKQSIVTLEQELSYIRDYIYIQQMRYHSRFEIYYDIDEMLLTQSVPKLVVQPIVENAVIHGIEGGQSGTVILLRMQRDEDEIEIVVKDDGVGMSQQRIEELFLEPKAEPGSKNTSHTQLGIYAVHKRLQFLYGAAYGVRVQSAAGEGTTVTIRIPYMKDPQKLFNTYNMLGREEETHEDQGDDH